MNDSDDPFAPTNPVTVYLTREQVFRLAALACDALVGMQVTTDDHDDTSCTVDMMPISATVQSQHFMITGDGTIEETT